MKNKRFLTKGKLLLSLLITLFLIVLVGVLSTQLVAYGSEYQHRDCFSCDYNSYVDSRMTGIQWPPVNEDYTRIYPIGSTSLTHDNAVVVVLMGDGFTLDQYYGTGTRQNPQAGTVLWHANRVMNTMLNTAPFNLFRHQFIVYVVHVESPPVLPIGWSSRPMYVSGRLGTVTMRNYTPEGSSARCEASRSFSSANPDREQIYLHKTIPTGLYAIYHGTHVETNIDMLHIISNARGAESRNFYGVAYGRMAPDGTARMRIARTSLRRATNGGTNSNWATAWHGTFVHESGHIFGNLSDEHSNGSFGEPAANTTRETNNNIKWRHWFGHRRVASVPRRYDGWAVPSTTNGCLMVRSSANRNFCGVCNAQLIRRMAEISGETFMGRHPSTHGAQTADNPFPSPQNPGPIFPVDASGDYIEHVYIPQGATRILDSAFHGNTKIRSVSIPITVTDRPTTSARPAVSYGIGDYAFIGVRYLERIYNFSVWPQTINNTTFWGLIRSNIRVYIPIGSYDAYRASEWRNFDLVECERVSLFEFEEITGTNNVRVRGGAMAERWVLTYWVCIFGCCSSESSRGECCCDELGLYPQRPRLRMLEIPSSVVIDGVSRTVTEIAEYGFVWHMPRWISYVPALIIPAGVTVIPDNAIFHLTNVRNLGCLDDGYCTDECGWCTECFVCAGFCQGCEWSWCWGCWSVICTHWCFDCGKPWWDCKCLNFEFDGYDVVLRAEDFGISDECLSLHGVLMLNTDDGNALIFHWVRGEVRDGYLYVFINARCFFSGAGGGASIDMIGGLIGFSFDVGGDVFYGLGMLELIARGCDGCCEWVFEECCEYWEYGCDCWDWWVPCCDYWWECDCLEDEDNQN